LLSNCSSRRTLVATASYSAGATSAPPATDETTLGNVLTWYITHDSYDDAGRLDRHALRRLLRALEKRDRHVAVLEPLGRRHLAAGPVIKC
jgi:hypothetical protein